MNKLIPALGSNVIFIMLIIYCWESDNSGKGSLMAENTINDNNKSEFLHDDV
jgi:hypothetical protein